MTTINTLPYLVKLADGSQNTINSNPYLVEGIGGGGDSGVTSGYYYNGNFYEDSEHTKKITPKNNSLYLDKSTSVLYLYDGTSFREVGSHELPTGGTTGQYLKKKSNTDFDTEWESLDNVFEEKNNKKQIINPVNTEYPSSYAVHNALNEKQNVTDNTLVTSNKTIPTSINELKGRIDNLQNIGRFLAIWDCSTGLPTSEPSEIPYEYKTGDYFRVGVVDETTNYMPNGSSYNGTASTTEFTGTGLSLGAVFYYDGTLWRLQASGGGGTVQDVQVDGTSVLVGGIAQIDLSNKQDVTLMVNIIDEDNLIIDSTSSEIYNALINGRAANLVGMNLSLVEYHDDDDDLIVSSYYGIGGYNFKIHENQIIDMTEVEFEDLSNRESTLSSSNNKYPTSGAVKNYVDNAVSDREIKAFVVTGTITSLNPLQAVIDKTFNEIYSAYQEGKQIYLVVPAINNASFKYTSINQERISWEGIVDYNTIANYLEVRVSYNDILTISMTPLAPKSLVEDKQDKINSLNKLSGDYVSVNALGEEHTVNSAFTAMGSAFQNIFDDLERKVNVTDIKDNVVSTDTNKPLSANMGKELNDRIQNLASIGKYLAMWDCATGLPTTNPITMPYTYTTGDYYVISKIDTTTNYMPNGSTYAGTSSITEYTGTETLNVGDFFYYDGIIWSLMKNTGKTVAFENIAGNPMDNSNLASALNSKLNITEIPVNDVKVDGTSVLVDGIAQIDLSNKEDKSNKVTTIDENSTDTQYPSAKAVYNNLSKVSESKVILKENSTGLTPLSEFDVGDSIFINEVTKGYTEYIIVEKNDIYEYVTLLRKNCISSMAMSGANSAIPYSQTLIDNYLNTTYKQEINSLNNYLYPIEKRVCYSKAYTRQYETFERSIYVPSAINMNISGNEDGDTKAVDWTIGLKSYYETEDLNTSRKAKDNMGDNYVEYWTASAGTYSASKSSLYTITTSGSSSTKNLTVVEYIRPAITINYDNLMLDDNRRIIIGVPYEPNPVDTVQDGNKYYKIKDTIHTFNENHNIRAINNDIQVFTDNGDVINDNNIYKKNIGITGSWKFIKNYNEQVLGFTVDSNKILVSNNGGLDFEQVTIPRVVKDIIYDKVDDIYKLLTAGYVYESSDGKNWTEYPMSYSTFTKLLKINNATSNTVFIDSSNKRMIFKNSHSYTGTFTIPTNDKSVSKIARLSTSQAIAYCSDGSWNYISGSNFLPMSFSLPDTLNELVNLGTEGYEEIYAMCINSNFIYKYIRTGTMGYSNDDYWEAISLPETCTTYDIIYNDYDGNYYILNDKSNYFKTKDFISFEKIDITSDRGIHALRTKEGILIGLENSENVLIAPAREKLENRLQTLKMQLDKTKWVGNGLQLNGEKISIPNSTTMISTECGIDVRGNSLDIFYFTEDLQILMRTRSADVLDYPIIGTQDYLDEWIWSEEILWEKLFDGPLKAIQVRWAEGGTFEEPYGYMEEYTVEKYERGCFYMTEYDELKYVKIGVEEPIGLDNIEPALGGI